MAIQVTCPSCHARFQVSDKFAGQTGPCPKCKDPIKIPDKNEEVVVHAPENQGPKDSEGRAVLKPIEREETKISGGIVMSIVGICLLTLVMAFVLKQMYKDVETGVPFWWRAIGAALLGPPLAMGCYAFLRDSELEPHRGSALFMRSLVCGLIYAALWGVYTFLVNYLFGGQVELMQLIYLAPPMIIAGGVTGLAAMELDFTSGAIHYAIYVAATTLVLFMIGMSPLQ